MVKGIDSRMKKYVKVTSATDEDGRVVPLSIEWEDGVTYQVDEVLDARQAASLKVGGTGYRYTIRVGHQTTFLFYENPRWYVEAKVAGR